MSRMSILESRIRLSLLENCHESALCSTIHGQEATFPAAAEAWGWRRATREPRLQYGPPLDESYALSHCGRS